MAIVAIGGRILVSADHILVRQEDYHEINLSVYTERRRARLEKRAVEQLAAMGYEVTISKTKSAT